MTWWSRIAAFFTGAKPVAPSPAATKPPSELAPATPASAAISTLPRGVRNNNPGNIDRDGTAWQGMAADQSGDDRFIVFTSAEYGIRALAIILSNYQEADGLHTIRAMIDRWAPPVENNSLAYVDFVAGRVGVAADAVLEFADYNLALPFAQAIIAQENANYAYPVATMEAGLAMAGIVKAQVEA